MCSCKYPAVQTPGYDQVVSLEQLLLGDGHLPEHLALYGAFDLLAHSPPLHISHELLHLLVSLRACLISANVTASSTLFTEISHVCQNLSSWLHSCMQCQII